MRSELSTSKGKKKQLLLQYDDVLTLNHRSDKLFFSSSFNFMNRKSLEKKRMEVELKEQKITELNQQLNKRKEQMDQLEKSLKNAGGAAASGAELSKKLADTQLLLEKWELTCQWWQHIVSNLFPLLISRFRTVKELEVAKEETKRSVQETERLLQLVQMSQEEQNAKEKQIGELQQWVEKKTFSLSCNLILMSSCVYFLAFSRALKNAQANAASANPLAGALPKLNAPNPMAAAEVRNEQLIFFLFVISST